MSLLAAVTHNSLTNDDSQTKTKYRVHLILKFTCLKVINVTILYLSWSD